MASLRRSTARLVLCACGVLSCFQSAGAHEGPPFPLLMDKPLAGYTVSVWADPDIGEARFFVVVESPQGGPPTEIPSVSMWVQPVSGRLERVTTTGERQTLRNQLQFELKPHFDQRDQWSVGFRITQANGNVSELATKVESTPPGYGIWDLAIYLFPFALLGGLWVIGMRRRTRLIREHAKQQAAPPQGNAETSAKPRRPPKGRGPKRSA